MTINQPKSFVLQLGSLITLYISVTALLVLLFGVINLRYPDEAASLYQSESAREGIRVSIALLIVFFPTYITLTRISNVIRRKEDGEYATLAKWLVYLSLLAGGGALLGDLVTLIVYFLNGEITIRFLLKIFVFFAVVASAFTYYLYDVRGYFQTREKLSIKIGLVAASVVLLSVIAGYMYIETPQEVREIRLDERQISDLQDIQWRIEDYYRLRDGFPESIDDLYPNEQVPQAPDNRPQYRFIMTGEDTYQLCATFVAESQRLERYPSPVYPAREKNYVWDYQPGEVCFDRLIESSTNTE